MTRRIITKRKGSFSDAILLPVDTLVELSSIASTDVVDKALIYVADVDRLFRFDYSSVVADDGIDVIAPDVGPGRWLSVTLTSGGGASTLTPTATVTTNTTADWGQCILVDTTAGNVSIILPLATGSGACLEIWKKVSANQVLVSRQGSDTVNGTASPDPLLAKDECSLYRDFATGVILAR